MKKNISNKAIAFITIGIIAMVAGISMAYFTNDEGPLATGGGVITALGLFLAVYAFGLWRNRA